MNRIRKSFAVATVLAAGAAVSADGVTGFGADTDQLMRMYPGLQASNDQGRVRAIYGVPMTPGLTTLDAATLFLQQHGRALGGGDLDLRPMWMADTQSGRHTVYAYQQYIDGMPVEHGQVRVLVLKGAANRVIYAGSTVSPRPASGAFAPMTVDAKGALDLVRGFKQYAKLPMFSQPQLVVYQGDGAWTEPVRAWKFVGEQPNPNTRERWTFFVDAATNSLIRVRNEVISADLNGTIQGKATPGMLPDIASNPPVVMAMPNIRVNAGASSVYTDVNGAFSFLNAGTSPIPISSIVGLAPGDGQWVTVDNNAGTEISVTGTGTPGSSMAPLIFNNSPGGADSLTTAQVNAFIHTNKIHDFYRSRSGTWDQVDVSLPCNVNLAQTCNAFWDGSSINFFKSGGGCVNTAFSDVVAHEYGHFVVQSLGLGQGGFGEGFADSGALLNYDQTLLGQGWMGPGTFVRAPLLATSPAGPGNIQYPCSPACMGESHCCGQILGAVWIRTRQNMGTAYGSAEGLGRTQQLFVDWMLITMGGTGAGFSNSANPTTAIEVLTVNDDDGYLPNGTPDYSRICPAFAAQSITCPPAPPLGFEFPNGRPTLTQPDVPTEILVNVLDLSRTAAPNTGKIIYRLDGGSYTTVNMTQLSPNKYKATIPAQPCNTNIDYYFSAMTTATTTPPPPLPALTVMNPSDAPGFAYYVPVALSIIDQWSDTFETNRGWSGVDPTDTALTGRWTRNIPQGTEAQPAADHTALGTRCWVTDYRAGQQISDYDVDDGKTTLTSPLLNATGMTSPRITYWLWYSNDVGQVQPNTNVFTVDVSNNNGVSWAPVKTYGPTGEHAHGKWFEDGFLIANYVPPTNQVLVRFIASDNTGAIVEAALDDFRVTSLYCGPPPPPPCYANCDGSTIVPILNINDYICFNNRFVFAESYANCDGSTIPPVLNIADFICFTNAYAAGCP